VVVAFNITLNNNKLFWQTFHLFFFFFTFSPPIFALAKLSLQGMEIKLLLLTDDSNYLPTYLGIYHPCLPPPPSPPLVQIQLSWNRTHDVTRGVSLVGYEFDKLWSPPSDREPKPVAAQEARYLPTYLRKDRVGKGHTAQPFLFFCLLARFRQKTK